MRYFDTIIVGQGLAGTALAWRMEFAGRQSFLVIDREPPVTSSRIAAGLVTPITGQRLVKTERFEERFAEAEAFYRRVEATIGSEVFHTAAMLRLFRNDRERAAFETKQHGEFAGLVEEHPSIDSNDLDAPRGGFAMILGGRLEAAEYLNRSREWFRQRGRYLCADLNVEADIAADGEGIRIPKLDLRAERAFFCQGFLKQPNPYFAPVPFQAAQGDILTLRIPGFRERRVLHAEGIWLAPTGGSESAGTVSPRGQRTRGDAAPPLYRCGSTYSWEPFDGLPSEQGRAELERKLRSFLKLPYEVVDHQAAVRPIIRESRPRIGMHPLHPRLGFFNGLGSKGSLLAPHFARKFVEHISEGSPLDPAHDVGEFL
jgi:glycine/D-amino acid oxidase-like deaminating enzyme